MRTKLYILLWMCCSVLLVACKGDDPIPEPEPPAYGSRTVLIYLAADNTLYDMVSNDIAEMRAGVAKLNNSGLHLLVYIDTGSSPRLIELVNKSGEVVENVIKSYEKRNSVGVAETQEVFNDVFSNKNYRAESYGLVYWSHGDGWIPRPLPKSRWVGQDESSGAFMNISDLVAILEGAPHFDFLLFDACFMQSIEVAYAVRNYTDYYLGSPTEIPGPGARYDFLVPAMFAEGDVALKTAIAYYAPYEETYTGVAPATNDNWTGGVSVSVLKSSELERLADMTKQVLSGTANNTELRSTVYNYDKRFTSSGSHVGYYDMVEMMRLLTDNAGFATWKQVYDVATPYWATTPKNFSAFAKMFSMEGTNGVSHYIPSSYGTAASTAYRTTEWYQAAGLSKLGW